jgi:gas vesicle protein
MAFVSVLGDVSATITSLGTLIVAIGAFITAAGGLWLAYRNSVKADQARERAATAAEKAQAAKDAAEQSRQDIKDAAEESKRQIVAIGGQVYELGKAVDGRLKELLELTKEAALAEGRLEGAATQKATHAAEAADEKPDGP